MNLPNKITITRICLSVLLLVMLLLPWSQLGVEFPVYQVATITVNLKYIIAGIIFLIAFLLSKFVTKKFKIDWGVVVWNMLY